MRLMRGGTAGRLESVKQCGNRATPEAAVVVLAEILPLQDLIGGRVSTVGSGTTPLGKPPYNMGGFPGYGPAFRMNQACCNGETVKDRSMMKSSCLPWRTVWH